MIIKKEKMKMGNVIKFRTRSELNYEKGEKIKEDWADWLEFEEAYANYLDNKKSQKKGEVQDTHND